MELHSFVSTFRGMLVSPDDTIIRLKERSSGEAALYYGIITLIYSLLTTVAVLITGPVYSPLAIPDVRPENLLMLCISLIAVMFISLGIGVIVVHFIIWIMDGAGNITSTLKAFCYAETPSALIGWIPLLGWIIASIWSLILLIYGLKRYHEISLLQAVIAVLLPAGVLLLIMIAGMVYLISEPEY